jgi:asparagine synthetase B (glutamine-hydrolysing)
MLIIISPFHISSEAGLATDPQRPEELTEAVCRLLSDGPTWGPNGDGMAPADRGRPSTVVFGHTHLAIRDLSPAGPQPMCDSVTGNWITYNGEACLLGAA